MFRFFHSFFNKFNIHSKLLVSYIFVILLPIFITGYFLVSQTIQTMLNHTQYLNQVNSTQLKTNISNQLTSFLNIPYSVSYEDDLMNYIEEDNPIKDYLTKVSKYRAILDKYAVRFPISRTLMKLSIYTTNDTIQDDNDFIIKINKSIREQQWYKDVYEAKGQSVFLQPFLNGTSNITIAKLLDPFSTNKYTNILKLDIPESEIYKLIEKEGVNKKIFILNNNNYIVSSTDRELLGKNASTIPYLYYVILHQPLNRTISDNKTKNDVFYDEITSNNATYGWKIITFTSLKSLSKSIDNIIRYSLFICLISFIIAFAFVFLFSNTLTKRLKLLVANMSKVSKGEFEVFVNYDGKDEIAELSLSFKIMIEKINSLINEVYILDIQKKEAEINALQSQINPHFLFNTMESIRMNLRNKQDYETSDIIQKFSKLLRKSIEWSNDKITLGMELELIENYLNIQKYRFRDKFEFEINIDQSFFEYPIPKFTLQPIVENSIYHGLEMKKGTGKLLIYTVCIDNMVKIIIEDDGVGMNEEKLISLKTQISNNNYIIGESRIGIMNVHQRIQLFFGKEYGIDVESKLNIGTKFVILLPKIISVKEDPNV